jgi:sirohydrochlorin ferrochelatase
LPPLPSQRLSKNALKWEHNELPVLPYFLSAGVHINRDIPDEVNKASQDFPNLEINVTNYFGSREEIAELLMKTAMEK